MSDKRRIHNLWLFDFAADFCAITAAYYTTWLLRFHSVWAERFFAMLNRTLGVRETGELGEMFRDFYFISAPRIIFFLTLAVCVLYAIRDLYPGRRFARPRPALWDVTAANMTALALFYAYFYLSRNVFHPRSIFATIMCLNVVFCVAFRTVARGLLRFVRSRFNFDECRAILIGFTEEANFLNTLIEEMRPHGIVVVHRVKFEPEEPFEKTTGDMEKAAREKEADMIISADKRLSVSQIMRLLESAERLDVPIKVLSDKMDVLVAQANLTVDTIGGAPLVHFEAPSLTESFNRAKRFLSPIFACVAMAIALPVMGLIAFLIKLTSAGPVFFVQERIGVNRKAFDMYKFRTMHDRADEVQAQVEEFNESGGTLFKIRKDPRVTPIGRFLRRFSLDELPQLINVLRGEMTIVGPRPLPRRDFENYYEAWHYARHTGLPGLTCLWQVSGRSNIDFHNMCILDVYYLRNESWVLDLKIILRTFWVVLFAKGAY